MFTGIVSELGRLRSCEPRSDGTLRLTVDAPRTVIGLSVGDSVAVNGCCLTAVDVAEGWWSADAVAETQGRTNLGRLRPGDPVNLERPLPVTGLLDGHLVQGHVDGVGRLRDPAPQLWVEVGEELLRYLVPKGSVTVDGVSLTVVDVHDSGFSVAVIPHTSEVTTLGSRQPGDVVNIEVDVVAKYVERLLAGGAATPYGAAGNSPLDGRQVEQ